MLYPVQRRRKIIVDKRFQWETTIFGLAYIVCIGLFVAIPFIYLIRATNGLLSGHSPDLVGNFTKLQNITMYAAASFFLLMASAWTLFSLRRSHRIAGPIISLKRNINEYATGNYSSRCQLRQKDELSAIADALNTMADKLQARERTLNEHLRNRIRSAKEEVFKNSSLDHVQEILGQLQSEVEEVLNQTPHLEPEPMAIILGSGDEPEVSEETTDELQLK